MSNPKTIEFVPVAHDPNSPLPNFKELYRPLLIEYFTNDDPAPEKQCFGDPENKTCCICQKKESDTVLFEKVSHLLPELLGNRSLISFEECDKCNGKYGDIYENELAIMLDQMRALSGTRGKRGIVEYTIKDKHGKISGKKKGTPLEITTSEEEGDIKLLDLTANSASIILPARKYRPMHAILSILKSVWLAMSAEQRTKHGYLLPIIRHERVVSPFQYHTVFVPSPWKKHTTLYAWEKTDSTTKIPSLVFELSFHNFVLIWASPDLDSDSYSNFVPPPIVMTPFGKEQHEKASIKMEKMTVSNVEKAIDFGPATWEFNFQSKIEVTDNATPKEETAVLETDKEVVPRVPVKLTLKNKEASYDFNTFLTFLRWDTEIRHFLIEGNEFAGILNLWKSDYWNFTKDKIGLNPVSVEIQNAKKSLLALKLATENEVDLIIEAQIPGPPPMEFSNMKTHSNYAFDDALLIIADIEQVNKELGTNFRYPYKQEMLPELHFIKTAIEHGAIRDINNGGHVMTLHADKEFGKLLIEAFSKDANINAVGEKILKYGHLESEPEECHFSIEKPSFVAELDTVKKQIANLAQDEIIPIKVNYESIVYTFTKWHNEREDSCGTLADAQ